MEKPTRPNRPDPNVLDLRALLAQRQAEAAQPRRRWSNFRPVAGPSRTMELHRPARPPRDWVLFRREALKFGAVIVAVIIISSTLFAVSRVQAARTSVERTSKQGLEAFQLGLSSIGQSQPAEAKKHFQTAHDLFFQASTDMTKTVPNLFDQLPLIGDQLVAGRRLLVDAERLASIGQRLADILPATMVQQPAVTIQSDGIIQGSVGVITSLVDRRSDFVTIVDDAVAVLADLGDIDPNDVPTSVRGRLTSYQRIFDGFVGSGQDLDHFAQFLLGLLAPAEPREYLVVFQNNDEVRPTGGFLGTFLLVKFERGTFKILDAPGNGPFALSDELSKVNLPPQPILSLVPYWTFHDANWYLDVPTSAQTMLDFYAQDRGFTPDGVIMLTPGVMEDLLRVTGPVRPEKYKIDITAENFVAATEQQVEFGYDKALNNPKQFLIDLVPLMIGKLSQLNGPDAMRALALTMKRANQGDFLFYSRDQEQQEHIAGLGWDGAVQATNGDYLAVVDTNLGGGKTDRSIDEQVHVAVTLDGAQLKHQVSVTRTHRGKVGDRLSGVKNIDFLRVYAPADAQFVGVTGATVPPADFFMKPDAKTQPVPSLKKAEGQTLLDEANGIRINHESGRMVFGAWSQIEPGQSQTIVFTYTTPAPNAGGASTWQFFWQHQPGAVPTRPWTVTFSLPKTRVLDTVSAGGKVKNGNRTVTFTSDSTINRTFSAQYK